VGPGFFNHGKKSSDSSVKGNNNPVIFGFNTDIKSGDTVYHVQSEAREADLLLQTQVFVRGRCIGKKATSYAAMASSPAFGDTQKEQILRDQHRTVLDAVREGRLESILDRPEAEVLATTRQLDIEWLNADSVHDRGRLKMQLRVTDGGHAASGARLTFRLARTNAAPFYTQTATDSGGAADVDFEVDESSLPDAAILVQASFEGRTATRKFLLRQVV
jgi:hypothetical protein